MPVRTPSTTSLSSIPDAAAAALSILLLFAATIVAAPQAHAQTFTVLHAFSHGAAGSYPEAGVTLDAGGNLYGTTMEGGDQDRGTAYQLKHAGTGWVLNTLFTFEDVDDDAPVNRVQFGPGGLLYGTTGSLYKLQPSATTCMSALCPWNVHLLHVFQGWPTDGGGPRGDLSFDQAGNIYGTTFLGGLTYNIGTVYEQTPSGQESVLYAFTGYNTDGQNPWGGVVLDNAGNLYGTTVGGGNSENCLYGCGTVFELTYTQGTGWTETILYNFQNGSDGYFPRGGVIFDRAGKLYGTTSSGGVGCNGYGCGTVFELSPSNNGWTYRLLYSFAGDCAETDCGPQTSLTMDAAGNLYGTTLYDGGSRLGNVFELAFSNGNWTYRDLHDFTGSSDGAFPYSNVTIGPDGSLYGTASEGGNPNCCGTVWKITP